MEIKETSRAGCSGKKQLVQETEEKVEAGDEIGTGTEEKTVRTSGFGISQHEDTFLWPNVASAADHSQQSISSAMSLAPQLMLLPSPTSRLPPSRPAFFYQSQPDSHSQSQVWAQSQAAFLM